MKPGLGLGLALALGAGSAAAPLTLGTHKAWRFITDEKNIDTYVGYTAVRAYDKNGTLIPSTGGTSFDGGPGSQGAHGPTAPWDGNPGTYWAKNAVGDYFGYIYSAPVPVARFELDAESAPRGAYRFRIQWSDDTTTGSNGTWTDAVTAWEQSWCTGGLTRSWPQDTTGGKYKAFRILCSANNTDRFVRLTECSLRASVGGAAFNTSTTGQAYQNNAVGGFTPGAGFDGSTATATGVDTSAAALPCWFMWTCAVPQKLAQYTVANFDTNARGMRDWVMQGTINGTDFFPIDTRAGITWAVPETKTLTVA